MGWVKKRLSPTPTIQHIFFQLFLSFSSFVYTNWWDRVCLGNFIQQMLCVSINFNLMACSPVESATVGCGMCMLCLRPSDFIILFWLLKGQNLLFLTHSLPAFVLLDELLPSKHALFMNVFVKLETFFFGEWKCYVSTEYIRYWSIKKGNDCMSMFHELYIINSAKLCISDWTQLAN